MCENPCYQCIPLRPLSDESAAEILDFLQVFMADFENRYCHQIRRYYDSRSQHNIVQHTPSANTDDLPF
jgi:hypothetical protein